jgi:hypothetical protein
MDHSSGADHSQARLEEFEKFCGSMTTAKGLKRRHVDYYKEYCCEGDLPTTFNRAIDPPSHDSPDEMQPIVRVENLDRPLRESGMEWDELRSAIDDGDTDFLDKFLIVWNDVRDNRPSFAAFRDSVLEDADDDDWPHLLRGRFDLAHFQPDGVPIAVAQMVYTVKDVLAECPEGAAGITTPTVLDSAPWPYFFPAPREVSYGRAMALHEAGDDGSLQAEILHTRISYKKSHLTKIGRIDRKWGPAELKDLRNYHLLCIRVASGREDFGEEML